MLPAVFSNKTKKKNSEMPDLDLYCSTQVAAETLGFTLQGVSNLIRQKKLEAIRFGKVYLVSKKSVIAYQEATKGKSKNDPHRGKTQK